MRKLITIFLIGFSCLQIIAVALWHMFVEAPLVIIRFLKKQ